jgi:hypothetical protein
LSSIENPMNPEKPLPGAERKEQRAREMVWENEGGSVRKDEKRAAQAPAIGTLANDNRANAA